MSGDRLALRCSRGPGRERPDEAEFWGSLSGKSRHAFAQDIARAQQYESAKHSPTGAAFCSARAAHAPVAPCADLRDARHVCSGLGVRPERKDLVAR
jgi:hypothetical protein